MMTFGDFPVTYKSKENSRIIVQPIPYEHTSTWMKGTWKGPQAILEASCYLEWYDIETGTEPFRNGIFTADFVSLSKDPEQMVSEVRNVTSDRLMKYPFIITIGGEHSVSVGVIQAFEQFYNKLTVIQIDAHADLRNSYHGTKFNHACVMARIQEICPIIQIGIRSMDISEKDRIVHSRVFWGKDIYNRPEWIEQLKPLLSEYVYITIDLDGLDPSIMPSTGTPEPGGISWYQILAILQSVSSFSKIVGFDIVELCPSQVNKSPDFLAAKINL